VFAILLMVWAWRIFPKKHPARVAANWTFGLTISEALVGAALVLLALVEQDQSVRRAISISIHLVNTLFLLGALTLTVRYSGLPLDYHAPEKTSEDKPRRWVLVSLVAVLLLGTTGALTALGDTLFQSKSLASGFTQDFARDSHFLVKLRVFHPAMAVLTAIVLYLFSEFSVRWADVQQSDAKIWARALQGLVLIQMLVGGTNLLLLAPVGLQMVHLLLADLVWISFVMLSASVLRTPTRM
jgi:heme A synthase